MEDTVVVINSDSEEDEANIFIKNAELIWKKRLRQNANTIIFHHLSSDYKLAFPYDKFNNFYIELKKTLSQITSESTRSFIWQKIIQWLIAMKLSYSNIVDLKYDKRYNFILINFIAEYINYKCKLNLHITDDYEIQKQVNHILGILGTMFNGDLSYVVMTLLKIKVNKEYTNILKPIFITILSDKYEHKKSKNLISYLPIVFAFKQFKKLALCKKDREAINEIAVGKSFECADKCTPVNGECTGKCKKIKEGILPHFVPTIEDDNNRSFMAVSDLIGHAIKRKFGTKILLINKSLDLDEAIDTYFIQYERYIKGFDPSTLCRSKDLLSLHDNNVENTNKFDNMHNASRLRHQQQLLLMGKQQQHQHLSNVRDINTNLSNKNKKNNINRLLYNKSLNFKTVSNKKNIRKNNLNCDRNITEDIIEIDITDNSSEENDDDNIKNLTDITTKKHLKKSVPYKKSQQYKSKKICSNNNTGNLFKNNNISLENVETILLSSDEDDNNIEYTRRDNFFNSNNNNDNNISRSSSRNSSSIPSESENSISENPTENIKIYSRKSLQLNNNPLSPPSISPLRSVQQLNITNNNNNINNNHFSDLNSSTSGDGINATVNIKKLKKQNCITGEVSSTTLLDCTAISDENDIAFASTSAVEVHSASANYETIENIREVGNIIKVNSPNILSNQFGIGNNNKSLNYSDISSDDDDNANEFAITRNLYSRIIPKKYIREIEKAISSTSEINNTKIICSSSSNRNNIGINTITESSQNENCENSFFINPSNGIPKQNPQKERIQFSFMNKTYNMKKNEQVLSKSNENNKSSDNKINKININSVNCLALVPYSSVTSSNFNKSNNLNDLPVKNFSNMLGKTSNTAFSELSKKEIINNPVDNNKIALTENNGTSMQSNVCQPNNEVTSEKTKNSNILIQKGEVKIITNEAIKERYLEEKTIENVFTKNLNDQTKYSEKRVEEKSLNSSKNDDFHKVDKNKSEENFEKNFERKTNEICEKSEILNKNLSGEISLCNENAKNFNSEKVIKHIEKSPMCHNNISTNTIDKSLQSLPIPETQHLNSNKISLELSNSKSEISNVVLHKASTIKSSENIIDRPVKTYSNKLTEKLKPKLISVMQKGKTDKVTQHEPKTTTVINVKSDVHTECKSNSSAVSKDNSLAKIIEISEPQTTTVIIQQTDDQTESIPKIMVITKDNIDVLPERESKITTVIDEKSDMHTEYDTNSSAVSKNKSMGKIIAVPEPQTTVIKEKTDEHSECVPKITAITKDNIDVLHEYKTKTTTTIINNKNNELSKSEVIPKCAPKSTLLRNEKNYVLTEIEPKKTETIRNINTPKITEISSKEPIKEKHDTSKIKESIREEFDPLKLKETLNEKLDRQFEIPTELSNKEKNETKTEKPLQTYSKKSTFIRRIHKVFDDKTFFKKYSKHSTTIKIVKQEMKNSHNDKKPDIKKPLITYKKAKQSNITKEDKSMNIKNDSKPLAEPLNIDLNTEIISEKSKDKINNDLNFDIQQKYKNEKEIPFNSIGDIESFENKLKSENTILGDAQKNNTKDIFEVHRNKEQINIHQNNLQKTVGNIKENIENQEKITESLYQDISLPFTELIELDNKPNKNIAMVVTNKEIDINKKIITNVDNITELACQKSLSDVTEKSEDNKNLPDNNIRVTEIDSVFVETTTDINMKVGMNNKVNLSLKNYSESPLQSHSAVIKDKTTTVIKEETDEQTECMIITKDNINVLPEREPKTTAVLKEKSDMHTECETNNSAVSKDKSLVKIIEILEPQPTPVIKEKINEYIKCMPNIIERTIDNIDMLSECELKSATSIINYKNDEFTKFYVIPECEPKSTSESKCTKHISDPKLNEINHITVKQTTKNDGTSEKETKSSLELLDINNVECEILKQLSSSIENSCNNMPKVKEEENVCLLNSDNSNHIDKLNLKVDSNEYEVTSTDKIIITEKDDYNSIEDLNINHSIEDLNIVNNKQEKLLVNLPTYKTLEASKTDIMEVTGAGKHFIAEKDYGSSIEELNIDNSIEDLNIVKSEQEKLSVNLLTNKALQSGKTENIENVTEKSVNENTINLDKISPNLQTETVSLVSLNQIDKTTTIISSQSVIIPQSVKENKLVDKKTEISQENNSFQKSKLMKDTENGEITETHAYSNDLLDKSSDKDILTEIKNSDPLDQPSKQVTLTEIQNSSNIKDEIILNDKPVESSNKILSTKKSDLIEAKIVNVLENTQKMSNSLSETIILKTDLGSEKKIVTDLVNIVSPEKQCQNLVDHNTKLTKIINNFGNEVDLNLENISKKECIEELTPKMNIQNLHHGLKKDKLIENIKNQPKIILETFDEKLDVPLTSDKRLQQDYLNYQNTPFKLRIKRRFSQCANKNETFEAETLTKSNNVINSTNENEMMTSLLDRIDEIQNEKGKKYEIKTDKKEIVSKINDNENPLEENSNKIIMNNQYALKAKNSGKIRCNDFASKNINETGEYNIVEKKEHWMKYIGLEKNSPTKDMVKKKICGRRQKSRCIKRLSSIDETNDPFHAVTNNFELLLVAAELVCDEKIITENNLCQNASSKKVGRPPKKFQSIKGNKRKKQNDQILSERSTRSSSLLKEEIETRSLIFTKPNKSLNQLTESIDQLTTDKQEHLVNQSLKLITYHTKESQLNQDAQVIENQKLENNLNQNDLVNNEINFKFQDKKRKKKNKQISERSTRSSSLQNEEIETNVSNDLIFTKPKKSIILNRNRLFNNNQPKKIVRFQIIIEERNEIVFPEKSLQFIDSDDNTEIVNSVNKSKKGRKKFTKDNLHIDSIKSNKSKLKSIENSGIPNDNNYILQNLSILDSIPQSPTSNSTDSDDFGKLVIDIPEKTVSKTISAQIKSHKEKRKQSLNNLLDTNEPKPTTQKSIKQEKCILPPPVINYDDALLIVSNGTPCQKVYEEVAAKLMEENNEKQLLKKHFTPDNICLNSKLLKPSNNQKCNKTKSLTSPSIVHLTSEVDIISLYGNKKSENLENTDRSANKMSVIQVSPSKDNTICDESPDEYELMYPIVELSETDDVLNIGDFECSVKSVNDCKKTNLNRRQLIQNNNNSSTHNKFMDNKLLKVKQKSNDSNILKGQSSKSNENLVTPNKKAINRRKSTDHQKCMKLDSTEKLTDFNKTVEQNLSDNIITPKIRVIQYSPKYYKDLKNVNHLNEKLMKTSLSKKTAKSQIKTLDVENVVGIEHTENNFTSLNENKNSIVGFDDLNLKTIQLTALEENSIHKKISENNTDVEVIPNQKLENNINDEPINAPVKEQLFSDRKLYTTTDPKTLSDKKLDSNTEQLLSDRKLDTKTDAKTLSEKKLDSITEQLLSDRKLDTKTEAKTLPDKKLDSKTEQLLSDRKLDTKTDAKKLSDKKLDTKTEQVLSVKKLDTKTEAKTLPDKKLDSKTEQLLSDRKLDTKTDAKKLSDKKLDTKTEQLLSVKKLDTKTEAKTQPDKKLDSKTEQLLSDRKLDTKTDAKTQSDMKLDSKTEQLLSDRKLDTKTDAKTQSDMKLDTKTEQLLSDRKLDTKTDAKTLSDKKLDSITEQLLSVRKLDTKTEAKILPDKKLDSKAEQLLSDIKLDTKADAKTLSDQKLDSKTEQLLSDRKLDTKTDAKTQSDMKLDSKTQQLLSDRKLDTKTDAKTQSDMKLDTKTLSNRKLDSDTDNFKTRSNAGKLKEGNNINKMITENSELSISNTPIISRPYQKSQLKLGKDINSISNKLLEIASHEEANLKSNIDKTSYLKATTTTNNINTALESIVSINQSKLEINKFGKKSIEKPSAIQENIKMNSSIDNPLRIDRETLILKQTIKPTQLNLTIQPIALIKVQNIFNDNLKPNLESESILGKVDKINSESILGNVDKIISNLPQNEKTDLKLKQNKKKPEIKSLQNSDLLKLPRLNKDKMNNRKSLDNSITNTIQSVDELKSTSQSQTFDKKLSLSLVESQNIAPSTTVKPLANKQLKNNQEKIIIKPNPRQSTKPSSCLDKNKLEINATLDNNKCSQKSVNLKSCFVDLSTYLHNPILKNKLNELHKIEHRNDGKLLDEHITNQLKEETCIEKDLSEIIEKINLTPSQTKNSTNITKTDQISKDQSETSDFSVNSIEKITKTSEESIIQNDENKENFKITETVEPTDLLQIENKKLENEKYPIQNTISKNEQECLNSVKGKLIEQMNTDNTTTTDNTDKFLQIDNTKCTNKPSEIQLNTNNFENKLTTEIVNLNQKNSEIEKKLIDSNLLPIESNETGKALQTLSSMISKIEVDLGDTMNSKDLEDDKTEFTTVEKSIIESQNTEPDLILILNNNKVENKTNEITQKEDEKISIQKLSVEIQPAIAKIENKLVNTKSIESSVFDEPSKFISPFSFCNEMPKNIFDGGSDNSSSSECNKTPIEEIIESYQLNSKLVEEEKCINNELNKSNTTNIKRKRKHRRSLSNKKSRLENITTEELQTFAQTKKCFIKLKRYKTVEELEQQQIKRIKLESDRENDNEMSNIKFNNSTNNLSSISANSSPTTISSYESDSSDTSSNIESTILNVKMQLDNLKDLRFSTTDNVTDHSLQDISQINDVIINTSFKNSVDEINFNDYNNSIEDMNLISFSFNTSDWCSDTILESITKDLDGDPEYSKNNKGDCMISGKVPVPEQSLNLDDIICPLMDSDITNLVPLEAVNMNLILNESVISSKQQQQQILDNNLINPDDLLNQFSTDVGFDFLAHDNTVCDFGLLNNTNILSINPKNSIANKNNTLTIPNDSLVNNNLNNNNIIHSTPKKYNESENNKVNNNATINISPVSIPIDEFIKKTIFINKNDTTKKFVAEFDIPEKDLAEASSSKTKLDNVIEDSVVNSGKEIHTKDLLNKKSVEKQINGEKFNDKNESTTIQLATDQLSSIKNSIKSDDKSISDSTTTYVKSISNRRKSYAELIAEISANNQKTPEKNQTPKTPESKSKSYPSTPFWKKKKDELQSPPVEMNSEETSTFPTPFWKKKKDELQSQPLEKNSEETSTLLNPTASISTIASNVQTLPILSKSIDTLEPVSTELPTKLTDSTVDLKTTIFEKTIEHNNANVIPNCSKVNVMTISPSPISVTAIAPTVTTIKSNLYHMPVLEVPTTADSFKKAKQNQPLMKPLIKSPNVTAIPKNLPQFNAGIITTNDVKLNDVKQKVVIDFIHVGKNSIQQIQTSSVNNIKRCSIETNSSDIPLKRKLTGNIECSTPVDVFDQLKNEPPINNVQIKLDQFKNDKNIPNTIQKNVMPVKSSSIVQKSPSIVQKSPSIVQKSIFSSTTLNSIPNQNNITKNINNYIYNITINNFIESPTSKTPINSPLEKSPIISSRSGQGQQSKHEIDKTKYNKQYSYRNPNFILSPTIKTIQNSPTISTMIKTENQQQIKRDKSSTAQIYNNNNNSFKNSISTKQNFTPSPTTASIKTPTKYSPKTLNKIEHHTNKNHISINEKPNTNFIASVNEQKQSILSKIAEIEVTIHNFPVPQNYGQHKQLNELKGQLSELKTELDTKILAEKQQQQLLDNRQKILHQQQKQQNKQYSQSNNKILTNSSIKMKSSATSSTKREYINSFSKLPSSGKSLSNLNDTNKIQKQPPTQAPSWEYRQITGDDLIAEILAKQKK